MRRNLKPYIQIDPKLAALGYADDAPDSNTTADLAIVRNANRRMTGIYRPTGRYFAMPSASPD